MIRRRTRETKTPAFAVLTTTVGFALVVGVGGCKSTSDDGPSADTAPKTSAESAEADDAGGTPPAASGDGAAGPAVPAKDPGAVIEAHVAAMGGPEVKAQIKSLHFESNLDSGRQRITAKSDHWWVADGRFFESEEIPGFGKATLGYDGETLWSIDPINGPRTVTGAEKRQALWLSDPFHWWHWKDYHDVAKYLGTVEGDDGRTFDRVELGSSSSTEAADKLVADFDVETHLLARLSITQLAPTGAVPMTFEFSDYVDEGPLKVAKKQKAKLPLGEMTQVYATIQIDAEVDESRFAMPGADSAVAPAKPEGETAPSPAGPTGD